MSASMSTGAGIDLAARRATAERLWRQHTGGRLIGWRNPAGYTLYVRGLNSEGRAVGDLIIKAGGIGYHALPPAANPGTPAGKEQAAVQAIRAALTGGR